MKIAPILLEDDLEINGLVNLRTATGDLGILLELFGLIIKICGVMVIKIVKVLALAPSCETLGKGQPLPQDIKWNRISSNINDLLIGSEKTIESTRFTSDIQKFYIKSTDYLGGEMGNATNSIIFEGVNYSSKNRLKVNATNKIRARVVIDRNVPDTGFAFLSAGENYNDDKSLFLGDFRVKQPANGEKKGSIIWRKHINPNYDYKECGEIRSQSGIRDVNNLPDASKKNGGIWVQPLQLPSKPKYSGVKNAAFAPGDVLCLTETKSSSCTFLEKTGFTSYKNENRTFAVRNLIVKGKDAYFGVVTSDTSKVYLQVEGSLDVSNGGKICHIDNDDPKKNSKYRCGTGKPENLIIVFEQLKPNNSPPLPDFGKQRLSCSADGGINYTRDIQKGPLKEITLHLILSIWLQQGIKTNHLVHLYMLRIQPFQLHHQKPNYIL